MIKIIKEANGKFRKRTIKTVKHEMKHNRDVKDMVKTFKQHFKYDGWALGYEVNRDYLNVCEFNVLLELLNYKIYYNKLNVNLVFKPKRGIK